LSHLYYGPQAFDLGRKLEKRGATCPHVMCIIVEDPGQGLTMQPQFLLSTISMVTALLAECAEI